jgi:hypothetical protein
MVNNEKTEEIIRKADFITSYPLQGEPSSVVHKIVSPRESGHYEFNTSIKQKGLSIMRNHVSHHSDEALDRYTIFSGNEPSLTMVFQGEQIHSVGSGSSRTHIDLYVPKQSLRPPHNNDWEERLDEIYEEIRGGLECAVELEVNVGNIK